MAASPSRPADGPAWTPPGGGASALPTDPAIVEQLIARDRTATAALAHDIRGRTGAALLDFIIADIPERRRLEFDPRSLQAVMAGIDAARWLNEHLQQWLGERNAADALAQSVPNNVTSEMGLALLDVADAIRPHPAVVAFLERVGGDDAFLDALPALPGGREARDAIAGWLDRYGMRGIGEIDVTRPRWRERPSMLLPMLLGNVRHFAPGESARRFERGRRESLRKEHDVLVHLREQPDGDAKADETRRMIARLRTFAGYREHPKYGMVSRYFVYKQALLGEAERLVRAGVLRAVEDVFWLRLEELRDVARTGAVDERLLREREAAFRTYATQAPPRVLTSDGEMLAGSYRRDDLPASALVGLAVSAGTVEGRARVVLDPSAAELAPGDILVTRYTDPSWTPLFVAIAGLVTEVGGLMTHGAVIAREYGVPAVVGVERVTHRIADGQRVRVHGTDGFVELLA